MEAVLEKTAIERYGVLKKSGVAWLGEIPAHWEVIKIKHIFFEKKKKTNPALNCGSISFGKVVMKDDEKTPLATKASYQEVLKGDFLVNPLNLNYDLISLRIALSYIDVVVSSGYIVLENSVEINKEYFKYLLHRYDVAYMKLLGAGVRQTINFNDIANSLLIFPPIEEQTAIAAFLDRKTAQIDKTIAQKEKLIALLKERRQILIHKAVTRGLYPDVPMKDSGVEWIGEIPEHWEIAKLKNNIFMITGFPFKSEKYTDSGIKLARGINVKEGEFNWDETRHWPVVEKNLEEYLLKEGDILIGMDGSKVGKNFCKVKQEDLPILLLQRVARLRPKKTLTSDFLFNQIENRNFLLWVEMNKTDPMVPHIAPKDINDFMITIPPKREQTIISNFIQTVKTKIATAISLKQTEIEKLKEYKATLINAAVTGKIKVR